MLPWHGTELGLCWMEMDGMAVGGREGWVAVGQRGESVCLCVQVFAGLKLRGLTFEQYCTLHAYTYTQTVGCTYVVGPSMTKC